jgi:hypothetical protein
MLNWPGSLTSFDLVSNGVQKRFFGYMHKQSQAKYLAVLFLLVTVWARAAEPKFLPKTFNGWQLSPSGVKTGSDPAAVDPADSAVLKEYGFTGFETGTYTRNGRKMDIKAARFENLSGAYGAFSFYAQPQMQVEKIGDGAASNNSRILFYRGNILVDVSLERVTAMSAADLRALADTLPRPGGRNSAPPSVKENLPQQSLIPNTTRYIMGPVALERSGLPVPASAIDFSKGPDIMFARYRTTTGEAGMTVVEYPTPQIAAERLRAWQSANLPGGPFYFRRSGPLLAAVNGSIPQSEAESLLASVNYDADITMTQQRPKPREDRYGFIVALILLCVIVLLIALLIGLAFGGFRLVAGKLFPNRGFDRKEEVEIISLNLRGPTLKD